MTSQDNQESGSRRLARIMAVQTLYRASFGEETPQAAMEGMLNDPVDEPFEGAPDRALLSAIVKGTTEGKDDLMGLLAGTLDARMTPERLETLLRQILLAGAFELHAHADIAAGIIINDYVDVARTFYSAKEPGLVNAVLDKLAKKLR